MASILDTVDQRTQLAGKNRLELLLFRLRGGQIYGINVFKVREVLQCPKLTVMPKLKHAVKGVAQIRGSAIPVVDLSVAIGRGPIAEPENSFVIVTEYNQLVIGFLVGQVERIVNTNWEEIKPPPKGAGKSNYLTAVTELSGKLVEILDVEKVLAEVSPQEEMVSAQLVDNIKSTQPAQPHKVLIADDSVVARKQLERCLTDLNIEVISKKDGREALRYLQELADQGVRPSDELLLMISDIEMPEMDGYTLTASVRTDERLRDLYILLHTSLSGVFNKAMVEKVGANAFLAKFQPDELAKTVHQRMEAWQAR